MKYATAMHEQRSLSEKAIDAYFAYDKILREGKKVVKITYLRQNYLSFWIPGL